VLPNDLVDKKVKVKDLAENFLGQTNYPMVNVNLNHEKQTGKTSVSFTQKRFLHSLLNSNSTQFNTRFKYIFY